MGTRQRLAAAMFSCGLATQAFGEEHVVIVTGFAYFPEVIHVEPGDSIRFVNKSGTDQIVAALDGTWVIGPMPNEAEATLAVTRQTTPDYSGHSAHTPSHPISARMSFAPPPLG